MLQAIDFYCKLYEKLQHKTGEITIIMRPLRRFIRKLATWHISHNRNYFKININRTRSDVIVSFTSFPARIDDVYLVVLSMLHQTILPKKIILWLSKEQFKEYDIPQSLTSLVNDIFEIRMVDGDIRSYKKSYYVLKQFPNDNIFLIDDDLFYPTNTIETVLNAADEHQGYVICRFGSIMKYANGKPRPYNSWWDEMVESTENQNLFLGTGGGTLLRREYLFDEIDNIDLALSLCPIADDVWMNAMINLKKTPKYKINYGLILPVSRKRTKTLTSLNVEENLNDKQINNVMEFFIKHYNLNPFEFLDK